MKLFEIKKLFVDDEEAFYELLGNSSLGVLSSKYEDDLTINVKIILDKFSEIQKWKTTFQNEEQKVQELQNKLKDFESQGKKVSIMDKDIERLNKEKNNFSSLNEKLQSDIKKREEQIQELEKQVTDLSFIRGICDRFGTYRSLMKDVEIINYFRRNTEGKSIRWKQLDQYFKRQRWAESTVINHLKRLHGYGILKGREGFKGEYSLNLDSSEYNDFTSDMDKLIEIIMGRELYDLAKENWNEKE